MSAVREVGRAPAPPTGVEKPRTSQHMASGRAREAKREEVGIAGCAPPGHLGEHHLSGKGSREEDPQDRSLRGDPLLQGALCAENKASSFNSIPFAQRHFGGSKDKPT